MTTYIGLLRAINLAGRNKVSMAELRDLLAGLGFDNPRTLLQSGNVVFGAGGKPKQLEKQLEDATEARLGLRTDYFVRTVEEWSAAIAANPFPKEAERDPSHLLVTFLKSAPNSGTAKALEDAIPGKELVQVEGREAFIYFPEGIGRSKLTNALVEKKLGTRGTGRNFNTVLKLEALARER